MSAPTPKQKLRIITYLSPGVALEVFETVVQYLESVLDVEASLIYEPRWSGPPPTRVDPFTADEVDIGFMCSTAFLRLTQNKNQYAELCQAAPLHQHTNALGRPVYFSDVVVHVDNAAKYKTLHDLKGSRWAYNDSISLSGNIIVLAELKRLGVNASFFGNVIQSGGHLKSIEMVLNSTVDGAAIDSNTLQTFEKMYPEKRKKLAVVTSLGPMPVYPIVLNSRLSADMKGKITNAFLEVSKSTEWSERFRSVNILGYTPIDMSLYNRETEIVDLVKNMSISAAYY
ncbi:probable phosphite transport system-binding protein PtxB [Haliotis asinina]|uniref:probable phosphite transport system-binding protein PtxB n=1 Tax=Haliotis asinina TaxID=109174 RepID=UPI0035319CE0